MVGVGASQVQGIRTNTQTPGRSIRNRNVPDPPYRSIPATDRPLHKVLPEPLNPAKTLIDDPMLQKEPHQQKIRAAIPEIIRQSLPRTQTLKHPEARRPAQRALPATDGDRDLRDATAQEELREGLQVLAV
jgi:hypothetical protein